MSKFELRLAQARLAEDVGEADKDNEEDSCAQLFSSGQANKLTTLQTATRSETRDQRSQSNHLCDSRDVAGSGIEFRSVLPHVRYHSGTSAEVPLTTHLNCRLTKTLGYNTTVTLLLAA